ncbi:unnamed protein product [Spirodela intermedia]|uniref:Uncharacterized protein n=1 Tax=Spirodela intermedia TaxID=51605 RepID=A0A7I8KID0_SPIIN|nr:unnamed protein product [Spirodela intermedia]
MRQLKHVESIREYVEKFSMLILEVPRMDEEDKLHYFMERLQTLAQNEICRQGTGAGQGNHSRGRNETPLQIEGPMWTSADYPDRADRRMVRARLNPVLTQDQPSLVIEEIPHLNTIQLLNVVQVKAIQEAPRKLLFVEAIINSTPTKALVDSKATHNFLLEKEAHHLGLNLVHTNDKIKAINSEVQISVGLAQHVKTNGHMGRPIGLPHATNR